MDTPFARLTNSEIFRFYHSLADEVQKAIFMRDLAQKSDLDFESISNCFLRQHFPAGIRQIARDLVWETKLKLANSFHIQLVEQ